MTNIQNNIVPVFVAYAVDDEYGRLKRMLSVHRNEADAEFAAKNQGWYGGPGDVKMKHAIEDGLDLYILADFYPTCNRMLQRHERQNVKPRLEQQWLNLQQKSWNY